MKQYFNYIYLNMYIIDFFLLNYLKIIYEVNMKVELGKFRSLELI